MKTSPVNLPSRGLLYPADSPVKSGIVTVREMTARDEAILYAPGGTPTGRVNSLITACLSECRFPSSEMLMIDRMAILLAIRTLTFDSLYEFPFRCASCREQFKHKVDINKELTIRYMGQDAEGEEIPNFSEPFPVLLPSSQRKVGFRLLRGKDEEAVARHARSVRMQTNDPADPSFLYRLALMIVTIDDVEVKTITEADRFVKNLSARDSQALQHASDETEQGIDTSLVIVCPACGAENETDMPFSLEFFRPSAV